MCGITGWIDWQQVGKQKEVIVKKMTTDIGEAWAGRFQRL